MKFLKKYYFLNLIVFRFVILDEVQNIISLIRGIIFF